MAEEVDAGELVPVVEAVAAVELAELEERARGFARDSRAASTWRAYDRDFAHFRTWCTKRRPPIESLPATVALYLTALTETHKSSTIRRRLASISVAHQVAPPTGLRQQIGQRFCQLRWWRHAARLDTGPDRPPHPFARAA